MYVYVSLKKEDEYNDSNKCTLTTRMFTAKRGVSKGKYAAVNMGFVQ